MPTRRTDRVSFLLAAVVVALAAASCGSSKASSSSAPTTAPSQAATSGATTSVPPTTAGSSVSASVSATVSAVAGIAEIPADQVSAAGTFGSKPTVTVPSAQPPSHLEAADLIVGTGATAKAGDSVTVQYDGYSWTTRKEFDASWNRNQPFSFRLGAGQVIQGWDQGVAGMKVGGRRELIIPPSMAYGASSPTPAIAANDTLIFVVDLVSIG